MNYIEIKDEFKELLKDTQVLNDEINNKPDENNPVSDDYDNIKPEDFIKISEKKADTHHKNGEVNTKSQQNNLVSNKNY